MGLEDLCAGGGDCRAERELLRRAAEVEASSQDLIERRRQELVEQRLELEARAQAAEEELEAEKATRSEAAAAANRGGGPPAGAAAVAADVPEPADGQRALGATVAAASKTGVVKTWCWDKRFGFICPDDGGEDHFFHQSALVGCSEIDVGTRVHYETVYDERRGKRRARSVSAMFKGDAGGDKQHCTAQAKEKASVTAQSSAAAASPPAADAKAAALALGAEASRQQSEGRGSAGDLSAVWPELEGATAALRATEAELEEVRARAVGAVEEERRHLEASSAMYRLYASASGIRWGTSDEPEGYVALDSVRHFSTAGLGAQEAADKVWQTIEACLPQREDPAAAGGA
mmetsp:Transcript_108073/g.293060  ORF Transcript_108073/g.293060 Transcript_108073/m.293060 type:complete len:347 (+) Transcript_108073:83-1123(+)